MATSVRTKFQLSRSISLGHMRGSQNKKVGASKSADLFYIGRLQVCQSYGDMQGVPKYTSKTANITYTIFDKTLVAYSPYKRRRFKNRSDQTFCILLIKDVLSVNLHSVTRPIAYYYYYYYYLRQ